MEVYNASWEGKIENAKTFSFIVDIENLGDENATLKIYTHKSIINYPMKGLNSHQIQIHISDNFFFEGYPDCESCSACFDSFTFETSNSFICLRSLVEYFSIRMFSLLAIPGLL